MLNQLNGMRVIESIHATETVPVRKHKLTRSQITHLQKHMFKGITYHDRIQKKWNKRFGFKQVPGVMIVDPSKLSLGGMYGGDKVILAHPTVVQRLKDNFDAVKPKSTETIRNESMSDSYEVMKKRAEDRKKKREAWCNMRDLLLNNQLSIMRYANSIVKMDIGA